jgi:ribosomal-protein-alanine acetyltransferase
MLSDSHSFNKKTQTANSATFRESRTSDLTTIERILREASLSFHAPNHPKGDPHSAPFSQTGSTRTQVCEIAGEVVAVLQWRQVGEEAEIFDLAVESKYRRQGIGRLLLQRFLSSARERDVTKIFLEVRESNAAALALYRKLGFIVTGRRPDYYRDPEEVALLLQLNLT